MSKAIFERQFAKLELGKYASDIEHCKELADADYCTEAFLGLWILVEVISKKLQITYRASISADKMSNSILKKLHTNHVDTEKHRLSLQVIDISFSQAKEIYSSRREYVNAGDVISSLKLIAPDIEELKLKFLLASEVKETPIGFSSKTTIRERRNDIVHNKSTIKKEDFMNCMAYFDYFFSLTVAKLATEEHPH